MSRNTPGNLRPKLSDRIGDFYARTFIELKLQNWLGFLLLSGIACLFAWLLAKDMTIGLGFFAALVGLFLVIFCFTNVEAGFYIMLFVGFYGYYFSNAFFKGSLPIGIIFDCLVLVNFLGLIISSKDFRPNWKQFIRIPLVILMFLTFFYSILEMFNPNTMGVSASNWLGVRKFLEFILILFMAYMLFDNYQKIRRYTFALLLVASGCAIYGCIQQWHGLFDWELAAIMADPHSYALLWAGGDFRKFSTLPDPAAFGIIMAICSVFFMILSVYEKDVRIRLLFITGTIFMLLGMSYSGTRTAYAVALVGIVFFLVLNIDKAAVRKVGAFLLLVFLIIEFGPFSGNATIRRFRSTFVGSKDESYKVRLISRAFVQPYIRHHPIGAGMGTTGFNGAIEHPGNPLANFQPDGAYVTRAAEMGWIGLAINCILYFFVLKAGIQAFFRIKDERIKVYYSAGVSSIFAFYVGDYAQLAVGGPADVGIYFAIIAMILKQQHYDKDFETHSSK